MSTRNKEISVAFEDVLEGFNDALVLSRLCKKYTGQSGKEMHRSNDVIWRPRPYIAQSNNVGLNQTGMDYKNVQLSGSLAASPATPRSKINVMAVAGAPPVVPVKSKHSTSQPLPV